MQYLLPSKALRGKKAEQVKFFSFETVFERYLSVAKTALCYSSKGMCRDELRDIEARFPSQFPPKISKPPGAPDIKATRYIVTKLKNIADQDTYTGGQDSGSRGGTIPLEPTISRRSLVRGPVYLL